MTALYVVAGYLVVASLIAFIPATLARSKGRSFSTWWLVSLLTFGIFTLIAVVMLPTTRCPQCREVVHPDARVCHHCGHQLIATRTAGVAARPTMTLQEARSQRQWVVFFAVIMMIPLALTAWAAIAVLNTWASIAVVAGMTVFVAAIFSVPLSGAVRAERKLSSPGPTVTP